MINDFVCTRLDGIHHQLVAAHKAGKPLSSSSKGREREAFINLFLRSVFPPIYRFGSGDVTDINGQKSGQLDVVIEYPFAPTLPAVGSDDIRLYLAEGVAAVIEVKSNLATQWKEVQHTAAQLSPLRRSFGASISMGEPPAASVPLIAVGFEGWQNLETLEKNVNATPGVEAALVIENQLFASSTATGAWRAQGVAALWAMICFTHQRLAALQSASTTPIQYMIR